MKMKKQNIIKCVATSLFQGLFIFSLVGLVSCRKPKIEEEKEPQKYEIHTEETDGQIVVSEKYVPVDWDKASNEVLKANNETGDFTLKLTKEESNDIKKGSIMTIDVDSTIYLVKVTDYTINGDKVELKTEQGSLAEVLAGSSFELRMGDFDREDIDRRTEAYVEKETADMYEDEVFTRAYSMDRFHPSLEDGAAGPRGSKLKIYPSEYRYKDDEGNWHKVPAEGATRVNLPPISINETLKIPFAEDGNKHDKHQFSAGLEGSFTASLVLGVSLFADIPMEYASSASEEDQEDIEIANDATFKPTFFFDPSFDWSVAFYSTMTRHIEGPQKELAEKRLGSVKFMAGPVPVYIENVMALKTQYVGDVTGGLDFTISGHGGVDVPYYAGFSVNKRGAVAFSGGGPFTHTVSKPTSQISVGADFKFYVIPEFSMNLYGCVGPKVAARPYFDNHIQTGVGFVGAFDEPYLTWDMGIDLGAEWTIGLKLGTGKMKKLLKYFVDKDVEIEPRPVRLSKTKGKHGYTIELFSAPYSISCTNGSNIKYEQDNKIDFATTWRILGNQFACPISCFVYFEANGPELYEIGGDTNLTYTTMGAATDWKDGTVSVGWHPSSANSTLTATLYDGSGKIRGTTTIKANTAPDKVQAVDLGCSVLWANMNVGAESENDGGDLVGWGDNTGTHTQQWSFPDYDSYKENAVYSLKYYGGPNLDRSGIANSRHDYAAAKWGGGWRMPTKAQWEELMKKCDWEWDDARTAYKVTGKNGKFIYLPAAGYRIGSRKFNQGFSSESGDEKASCEYWSATMDMDTKEELNQSYIDLGVTVSSIYPNAYYFYAEKDKKKRIASTPKFYGQSVRPVFPNPNFGK